MKKLNILTLFLILSLSTSSLVFSQLDKVDFLKGGVNDAELLFQNYLSPYANILGANLNSGWYNTAKPHKLGGFDVTLTTNVSWAPTSDLIMKVGDFQLSQNAAVDGILTSPTVAGGKTEDRPDLVYSQNVPNVGDVEYARYKLPNGTGLKFLPSPMIQAGIGLPLGTEITARFLPTLSLGQSMKVGLWGVGLKHSIIQHIPGLKKLPVLDISAQGAFSKLRTYSDINYGPLDVVQDANHDYVNNSEIWLDQKIALNVTAWTANLVVSQTLPVISFYQAIGYSSSKVNLGLTGNYPMPSIETNNSSPYFGEVVVMNNAQGIAKDPIDLEMQNNKDLRLNAGMRIKLGVLTIHFDYTKANYSAVTAGLGISFR